MNTKVLPLEKLGVIDLLLDDEREARKRQQKWVHGEYATKFKELVIYNEIKFDEYFRLFQHQCS
jgi:hypothetical protein